ncbi:hypothetical protein BDQ12DRAFT_646024 [Crucibulum laeve]|uniref:Uncharacterized protein n=1 Tax=Crucibulum laeve TaxID=68775 RepID=A0A5C3M885_9AGAR|nr:hypothetical protein BDQ12DRAFT_646024 [Crucibulum laeve]
MLKAWTNIDIKENSGSKINSTSNCIFMSTNEHENFGRLWLYFVMSMPLQLELHMLSSTLHPSHTTLHSLTSFTTCPSWTSI